MPLYCNFLSNADLIKLNELVGKQPDGTQLKDECAEGIVNVVKTSSAIVYRSTGGFYFHLLDGRDVQTVMTEDITAPRNYLCSAFQITGDDVISKIHTRFIDVYGSFLASKIQSVQYNDAGAQLLLVKFPAEVVEIMMRSSGGTLSTMFSGSVENLQKIPTFQKYLRLPVDGGHQRSVFATEYGMGQYELVRSLHYKIVQEVVTRPNCGICLQKIASWSP